MKTHALKMLGAAKARNRTEDSSPFLVSSRRAGLAHDAVFRPAPQRCGTQKGPFWKRSQWLHRSLERRAVGTRNSQCKPDNSFLFRSFSLAPRFSPVAAATRPRRTTPRLPALPTRRVPTRWRPHPPRQRPLTLRAGASLTSVIPTGPVGSHGTSPTKKAFSKSAARTSS